MSEYDFLREFADSWGLLLLVILFLGIVIYTFRPGSARHHDRMAQLPLRHESAPDATPDEADDAVLHGDQGPR